MVSPTAEQHIARPVALQRWESLTFLHWSYDPGQVASLLPAGLQVDVYDGRAWVGVTPFLMRDVRPAGLPPVPVASAFPETNVRTYVRDDRGVDGLWFFTLECARAASLTARPMLGLPYAWSRMSVTRRGNTLRYTSSRRLPPGAASSDYTIDVGAPIEPASLDAFDHWLTGRWRAYSGIQRRLWCTPVDHEPWPLHRATARRLEGNLVPSTGLPQPTGDPVVHFSPGVDVRLGRPRRQPDA